MSSDERSETQNTRCDDLCRDLASSSNPANKLETICAKSGRIRNTKKRLKANCTVKLNQGGGLEGFKVQTLHYHNENQVGLK